jgi:DNA-binding transcriptional regulator YdaS (Cro superfamily)
MNLDQYLTGKQMTSETFARRIGMSLSAVNKYRSGARTPRPKVMATIWRKTACKVTPHDWVIPRRGKRK